MKNGRGSWKPLRNVLPMENAFYSLEGLFQFLNEGVSPFHACLLYTSQRAQRPPHQAAMKRGGKRFVYRDHESGADGHRRGHHRVAARLSSFSFLGPFSLLCVIMQIFWNICQTVFLSLSTNKENVS